MAALDSPFLPSAGASADAAAPPPTYARFAPHSRSTTHFRIARKSPLLLSTPPELTLALSRAYPWLRRANALAGLLTWSSGDAHASCLLLCAFVMGVLYGETMLRWGGAAVVVCGGIVGTMWAHRLNSASSLSATTTTTGKGKTSREGMVVLEQIVEEMETLTKRVEMLAEPLVSAGDFLSTPGVRGRVPALLLRVLLLGTPGCWVLAFAREDAWRVWVLAAGVTTLAWFAPPAKVLRTMLWRMGAVRWACEALTGLPLTGGLDAADTSPDAPDARTYDACATSQLSQDGEKAPADKPSEAKKTPAPTPAPAVVAKKDLVRFTFTLFENQRHWFGAGWTTTTLPHERAAWTDETLSPATPPGEFVLPHADSDGVCWRWVEGEDWGVLDVPRAEKGKKNGDGENGEEEEEEEEEDGGGWWYGDNKWHGDAREEGWGTYTRWRKWGRRAELVEAEKQEEQEGR